MAVGKTDVYMPVLPLLLLLLFFFLIFVHFGALL